MSGIAGIYYRDSRPVEAGELARMVDILAHRGLDGSGEWIDGSVGLGHRMLWTTSESIQERLPLRMGDFVITADARIDNRDELLHILDLRDQPQFETSDSCLILAAYQKWGVDSLEKLLGDFAFAIWDSSRQHWFCARDPLGVKPFYYFASDRLFLFASEIKAILCHRDIPKRINEERVAGHFFPMLFENDKESTFYQNIFRLPPAHYLIVSSQDTHILRYWSLNPDREIRLSSDDEYAQAFREHFIEAVQCRLRSAYPIGSTLSGGLDSSSIACTARDIHLQTGEEPIHTFSAVFKKVPEADESPYIQAVVNQGNIRPHYVYPDTYSPFIDLDRVLWHLDEPFYGPNYFMPWGLYNSAREHGVRVFLDGTDGDTTVSHGMDRLSMLARSREWVAFAEEAKAVTGRFDHPRYASQAGILYAHGAPFLTDLARHGKIVSYARGVNELGKQLGISRKRLLVYTGIEPFIPQGAWRTWRRIRGLNNGNNHLPTVINPEFALRIGLESRLQGIARSQELLPTHDRYHHMRYLDSGILPYSLGLMNGISSAFSIEIRFPFCDRRLVEFCLALPSEQKLRQGWNRFVLRTAMNGTLPEKVQWRGGKISLAQINPRGIKEYAQEFVGSVLSHPAEHLCNYINLSNVNDIYNRFLSQGDSTELDWVWFVTIFSRWLQCANLE